jgi:hypothetical protein
MKKLFWIVIAVGLIAVLFWIKYQKHMMKNPTRSTKAAMMAEDNSSLASLPHFASLNSGRMQRNAANAGATCGWGKLTVYVNKMSQEFKDAKVWVGSQNAQAKEWDWKKTGTQHAPGIQPADLYEFIDQVDEVILTRGVEHVLQVPQETIDYVKSKGKECHAGQTADMIELFNTLVDQGKKVGGVFHSTC